MENTTQTKTNTSQGKLIAAIGLPGSGKSSVTRALGQMLNVPSFHEPEESEYAEVVNRRDIYGSFTAMTWFRSARMPNLYQADKLRREGKTVIIDSYYDKLFSLFMDRDGMQWLIKTSDPYFKVVQEIARLDWQHLPNADYLICFELDYETWLKFLRLRNRSLLDKDEAFLNSFKTQAYFIEAATQFAEHFGCQLIRFKQEFSSLESSALRLKKILEEHGIKEAEQHSILLNKNQGH